MSIDSGASSWASWCWFPMAVADDPRTKPGHLALRLALAAVEIELDLDERLEDLAGGIELPTRQGPLMELAGFGDSSTLDRYRRQLDRWHFISYRPRRGKPSTYRIQSHWSSTFDHDAHVAIPLGIPWDAGLSVQARALYVALSVIGERERQAAWPRELDGTLPSDSPMYPHGCTMDRAEARRLAGFGRDDQLQRFLDELTDAGHVSVARGTVELATSKAAESVVAESLV